MSDRAALSAPARSATAVTPSDSTEYLYCRGVYVGGEGDLTVVMRSGGGAITFSAVPAGSLLPLDVKKIMAATTATLINVVY